MESKNEVRVVRLTGTINTSYTGYCSLIKFYQECKDFKAQEVHIDFYHLEWLDGNLCSLFESILYKLYIENNLIFKTDIDFLMKKFDVFFRNGFLKGSAIIEDVQKSTVAARNFDCTDKEGFNQYVSNDLMSHRGMPKIEEFTKDLIIDDLIEIFSNTKMHANTTDPFFVAGQYYPSLKLLRFTMVDLGEGFLPKISKATNGSVKNDKEAILWAIQGNSSKHQLNETPGGLGLSRIYKFVSSNGGYLDIITGRHYWSSEYNTTIFEGGRDLGDLAFCGTTIHLTFHQK